MEIPGRSAGRRRQGAAGDVAFKLHDTYGFPARPDQRRAASATWKWTRLAKTAMEKQKAQARAAGKFKMDKALDYTGAANQFTGYEHFAKLQKS